MGLFDFLFGKTSPEDSGDSSLDGFCGSGDFHSDFNDGGFMGHDAGSGFDDAGDFGKDGSGFGGSFITYDSSYFKNNDEDRAICEDMFGDRAMNHDIDLEYHYGWENKLNYDTDGYEDEEDW